ncbi:MAG: SRPBCC family protein [Nocardioidaceae bacterium]
MSTRSVIHDTFTIQRRYPVPASKVFAAFASAEAKNVWGDTGNLEPAEGAAGVAEFDFRPGGSERFGFKMDGTTYRYDAQYYDIVPDRRIVYAYQMYADDRRISVSVSTVDLSVSGDDTMLTYTEQGAYLDGFDGSQAPSLRREGTTEMLDNLTGYLASEMAG